MNNLPSMSDYLTTNVYGKDGIRTKAIKGRFLCVQEDWNVVDNLVKYQDAKGNLRVRVYIWDENQMECVKDPEGNDILVTAPGFLTEHTIWTDHKTGEVHEYDHRVSWDILYDMCSVHEWQLLALFKDDLEHSTRQQELKIVHAETSVVNEKTVYQNTVTDRVIYFIDKSVTGKAVGTRMKVGQLAFLKRENGVTEEFDLDAYMALELERA